MTEKQINEMQIQNIALICDNANKDMAIASLQQAIRQIAEELKKLNDTCKSGIKSVDGELFV